MNNFCQDLFSLMNHKALKIDIGLYIIPYGLSKTLNL